MAETYYIRLPFYLINGTTAKTVNISFDNNLVSTAEITATDINNKNYVNFSVTKDFGIYGIKIAPQQNEDDFTTLCLEDIWVSNDNVNFYSVLVNCSEVTTNLTAIEYGFNPAKGACLWADFELDVAVSLPDAANWNKTYKSTNLSKFEESIALLTTNPDPDASKLSNIQEAYSLFKARGYN